MRHAHKLYVRVLLALCITIILPPNCILANKQIDSAPSISPCFDSISYRFNEFPSKDCQWVAEKAETRCEKYEALSSVFVILLPIPH
jgi:hypothetical protein